MTPFRMWGDYYFVGLTPDRPTGGYQRFTLHLVRVRPRDRAIGRAIALAITARLFLGARS